MADYTEEWWSWLARPSIVLAIVLVYFTLQFTYNIYLHPLSKVPGPIVWSASRLPFVFSLLRGTLIHDVQELHRHYGPILRIAPGEVTFSRPDAWNDIFQVRPGHQQFPKDPVWFAKRPNKPDSILSALDPDHHARIRKTLAPAFTARALRMQEPILHQYVNLLVDRVQDIVKAGAGRTAVVDITPWMGFTTFDIFGDLGFGESFDCLQNSKYHPWIDLLFNSVKAATYLASARFYPAIDYVLLKLVSPSLQKTVEDHYQQIVDKVDRRFNWELEREDIMSHIIKAREQAEGKSSASKGMSIDEINSTFTVLTTAGSETTATTLSGTINYLINCPEKLESLVAEIRGRFESREEMTVESLKDVPYLNAVLREGLRLCPPVPWMLPRCAPPGGDTVCGVWLPGGTQVSIQAYTMNRDPALYHAPDAFHPERWLPDAATDSDSPFFNDKRDALQPFSVGPRSCIGQNLAWAEMRLILSNLIWQFNLEADDSSKRLRWEDLRAFLLVEQKPVNVKISLRSP